MHWRDASGTRAIEQFNAAIDLDPDGDVGHNARFNRGTAYVNRAARRNTPEDLARAIRDFDAVIARTPRFTFAHIYRGIARHREGNYDMAIADFDEALRLDPDKDFALFHRGRSWQARGRFAEAIADFEVAIRLNDSHPPYYNSFAWLLATCPDAEYRDGSKAIILATNACELANGENAAYVGTLAAAFAQAGDFDEAIRRQMQAVKLAPEAKKDDYRSRLRLYQQGKPFRDDVPRKGP